MSKHIFVIQGTFDRTRYAHLLLRTLIPSDRLTNPSYVITSPDDSGTSVGGMKKALKKALEQKPKHITVLQEDIIVCKDFIHTVQKLVEKYPSKLISYFTPQKLTGNSIIEKHNFCYAQAYSLPSKMAKEIINFKSDNKRDDGVIGEYLNAYNLTHLITNPSLVEHLGWAESTTKGEKARLQTYDKRRMAGKFIGLENSFCENMRE